MNTPLDAATLRALADVADRGWCKHNGRELCNACMDAIAAALRAYADAQERPDNERILFERLSQALTGGNAGTWDEVVHAAEKCADAQERPAATESRSVQKRKAIQRGEPMPTFTEAPAAPAAPPPTEDEINRLEKAAWDAKVDRVLVWYRDRIEELEQQLRSRSVKENPDAV